MSVLSTLPAGTFNIDPSHSRVGFSARHAMVTKVRGAFNEYTGSATTSNGSASLSIEINAASIDTRSADRDGHLKSGDFFEIEKYPTMKLVSTQCRRNLLHLTAIKGEWQSAVFENVRQILGLNASEVTGDLSSSCRNCFDDAR